MILRASIVVTMDGPPIENGAVAIDGGRIVDVGTFADVKARNSGDVVDLGNQALLPGLINAHCHLDYTCLRGKIPRPESFSSWIRAIIAAKERLSPPDYVSSINEGFAEAKKFGTTAIANLTAFPELIPQIQPPIRTWWFPELIDIRQPPEDAENLTALSSQVSKSREQASPAGVAPGSVENWGLAPHALFTASSRLYRRCEEVARNEEALLTTHLAESREEMEMFRDSGGALADFLSQIGRDNSDLHGVTPVQQLSELCELDERWLLVHLNEIMANDLEVLMQSKTQPHIVHCPRSHEYFGHSPFQFEKFRTLGFNVCLATDSLASNDSLSLFAEMRVFQCARPEVAPREILEMVTVSPAKALHQENKLGRFRAGFQADLIAVPCSELGSVFDEIAAFDGNVLWMMINGEQVAVS